jgi:hypothetical protein
MADKLSLKMVRLSTVRRWERNPKPHDLGALIASFQRNGFRDPIAFDQNLNGGEGGLVEGNGRDEALEMMFEENPDAPPRGIGKLKKDGEWTLPVIFGLDSSSEAEAEAYALDHNGLTVTGGNFGPDWQRRLYDLEELDVILEDLHNAGAMPLTIDGDDLDAIKALRKDYLGGEGHFDATKIDGAAPPGEISEAFLIYVTFESQRAFLNGLAALTLGARGGDKKESGGQGGPGGISKAVVDGEVYVGHWLDSLSDSG